MDEEEPPPSYPGPGPVQLQLTGSGEVTCSASACGDSVSNVGEDVLSVQAGEAATHYNLDQLLSIVQSFQLDTTHATTSRPPGKVRTTHHSNIQNTPLVATTFSKKQAIKLSYCPTV